MRPEKATIVSDLAEKINRSPFLLVTDYQRMKVDQFGELRNRLAPAGAEVRVVKNSFLKRAMADSGMPDVADQLTGQTAIVMGENDVAPVAKILKLFAAEFKIATLKIGVVDKSILSTTDVEALAELPSREILLSRLLGLFLAPATSLVRVLNEPASAFARLLKAKGEQGAASQATVPRRRRRPPLQAQKRRQGGTFRDQGRDARGGNETRSARTRSERGSARAEPTSEAAAATPATESTTGETATEKPA